MPNQTIQQNIQNPELSEQEEIFRNMYNLVKNNIDNHSDNPQLLLFIGVMINDVDMCREAIDVYNASANELLTQRNSNILNSVENLSNTDINSLIS